MDPSYSVELGKTLTDPHFHLAVIWGMWVMGHLRWIERRLKRVEDLMKVMPGPEPMPNDLSGGGQ